MTKEELFTQKAAKGYLVCYVATCPLREQCLRYAVGKYYPPTQPVVKCINSLYAGVGTDDCHFYRQGEKVQMACGITRIFTDDMPRSVEGHVRSSLRERFRRTVFFEYRNGTRLIPPDMQEYIRRLFREAGWDGEVEFDSYVEDYNW